MTDTHDAGTGPPVPASSSVDPVPPGARRELERIRRRWSELALPRLDEAAPAVRAAVTEIAALTAPDVAVPEPGPEVLADQLAVVVWDACATGHAEEVEQRLTALRRRLP